MNTKVTLHPRVVFINQLDRWAVPFAGPIESRKHGSSFLNASPIASGLTTILQANIYQSAHWEQLSYLAQTG